ncbi:MAG: alpha/beta hydrolase [Sphingobacteriales bacterium]|nr:alpha/beta hydrolase [Sphingobacteriales bacterium]
MQKPYFLNYFQAFLSLFLLAGFFSSLPTQAQCGDRFMLPIFETIDIDNDIEYGSNTAISGNKITLKFDLYQPVNDTAAMRPLIILAHGGTFLAGNENSPDIVQLADSLAHRGYVVASINYRLLSMPGDLAFPLDSLFTLELVKAVADMRSAIRYFKKDAATINQYRIDPEQVWVGGASAGAILALHTAYFNEAGDLDYFKNFDVLAMVESNGGWEGDSGNNGYDTKVAGVINLCGALGNANFIQRGDVPVVNLHGDKDKTVPYNSGWAKALGLNVIQLDGSNIIQKHCDSIGVPSALLTFEGQDHMAHATPENFPKSLEFIVNFLYEHVDCNDLNTATNPNPKNPASKPLVQAQYLPQLNTIEVKYAVSTPATTTTYNNTTPAKIQLVNAIGQVISSQQILANQEGVSVSFPTNYLPKGWYAVQVLQPASNNRIASQGLIVY